MENALRYWPRGGLPALILLGGFFLGFLLYSRVGDVGLAAPKGPSLQGVPAQRTTITAALTATGPVVAGSQVNLTFPQAGRVQEIFVKEGDEVKAGQQLARLETTDLELKVLQAEAQLAAQKARLSELLEGSTASDIATARQGVASAEATLTKARNDLAKLADTPTAAEVAAARASLTKARSDLETLRASPTAADIAAARASLTKATNDLGTLLAGPTATDIAAARQGVATAEASLTKVKNDLETLRSGPTPAEIAGARADVARAQSDLAAAWANYFVILRQKGDGITSAELQAAIARIDSAEAALKAVQAKVDELLRGPTPQDIANADANFRSAEAALASAQAKLDEILRGPTPQDIANVEANVVSAQAKLDELLRGPTPQDIATAEATLASAQAKLDEILRGPTPLDIANAEANIRSAEAAVAAGQARLNDALRGPTSATIEAQRAQLALADVAAKQAQRDLERATLLAPFDGTITGVAVSIAEQISTATRVITIFNSRLLQVELSVGEADVARLRSGQRATVTLDAIPGRNFNGRLSSVAAAAVVQQGVANFPVIVVIDPPRGEAGMRPTPGMTAAVAIITAERENVLAIPGRALRREGNQQMVEVVANGQKTMRPVTTGFSGGQLVEVREGLNEGEVVVLPATRATAATATTFGGFIPGVGPVGGRAPAAPPRR